MPIGKGQPSLLRTLNSSALLTELLDRGPQSRAELSRSLGISVPTVLEIVSDLLKRGIVIERDAHQIPRGRPAQDIGMKADAAQIICLDVGGTNIKAGRFNFNKEMVEFAIQPTPKTSRDAVVEKIVELIEGLTVPSIPNCSIVVGAPGFVRDGVVAEAANLPDWVDVPLQSILSNRFHVPVVVENDVNLAVLGEANFGIASGHDNVVFIGIGSGIGAGILVERKLLRGARGAGGEIAFIVPQIESLTESYGGNGALETLAATSKICKYWNETTGETITDPLVVVNAARSGSSVARHVIHRWAQYIGIGMVALSAILNPEIIVIGGGGGHTFDLIEHQLQTYLKTHLPFPPIVAQTALDDRVALWGGLTLGLDVIIEDLTQKRIGA